jgi:hypothetical protein
LCLVCVSCRYGSRALELLRRYFENEMANVDSDEDDEAPGPDGNGTAEANGGADASTI